MARSRMNEQLMTHLLPDYHALDLGEIAQGGLNGGARLLRRERV